MLCKHTTGLFSQSTTNWTNQSLHICYSFTPVCTITGRGLLHIQLEMQDENTNPVLNSSRSDLVFFWVVRVANRYLNHFLFPSFSLSYPNWDLTLQAKASCFWWSAIWSLFSFFIFLPFGQVGCLWTQDFKTSSSH